MKVVFMGTPDFAVRALRLLIEKHEVVCVYTQAPKEAGRGYKVQKSPVHLLAEEHGIEVRCPRTLRDEEEQKKYQDLKVDVCVVAAYGLILPAAVFESFPCVNIHGSILPRWRGAAPVQRAIEAGDAVTGVTIMQIVQKLDAGAMYLKKEVAIAPETTGGELYERVAEVGAEAIVEYLDNFEKYLPVEQNENEVTYAEKIDKTESRIDFNFQAEALERKIRAFNPYPAMYFEHNGERFKVYKARAVAEKSGLKLEVGEIKQVNGRLLAGCVDEEIEFLEVQRPGKKAMLVPELLKGYSFN